MTVAGMRGVEWVFRECPNRQVFRHAVGAVGEGRAADEDVKTPSVIHPYGGKARERER